MDTQKLPSGMSEKLGYYVYIYVDPETNLPFYMGKGKGNRVYAHLSDTTESAKVQQIQFLRNKGLEPRIEILCYGLPDEETAYHVEAAAIDLFGKQNLTNEARGWRSGSHGRIPLAVLISYEAPSPVDISDPCIIIRINDKYYDGMNDQELYESTRGVWKLSERREAADYALAVFDGIVREVYQIDYWVHAGKTKYYTREDVDAPDRWEFVGKVGSTSIRDKYRLRSVRHYLQPNNQNPIVYVNCSTDKGVIRQRLAQHEIEATRDKERSNPKPAPDKILNAVEAYLSWYKMEDDPELLPGTRKDTRTALCISFNLHWWKPAVGKPSPFRMV